MTVTRAEAFAPATVANLGIGFDILGLALCEPGDVVRAEWRDEPGAVVIHIEGDGGKLSKEPGKNTASVAANSLLRQLGSSAGVNLTIYKNLPLASGLGSSAASAVAAVVAVNALLGEPLTTLELLPSALDGEASVSGYHADNVCPCLVGGICLVAGITADRLFNLPVPTNLHLALVTPDVAVPTALARAALPASIPLKAMVSQTGGVARLMDALYRDDLEALAAAMETDTIIEPARAHLMPLLPEMRALARKEGALNLVISGAGPTLCCVCADALTAERVARAMQSAYEEAGIPAEGRHTQVSQRGSWLLPQGG
jgi:homoserine kinase